ncbi:hypothetical protein BR93DRAFT_629845 [Coniochaeta sp. PMI_546]|nr:hypothetical protein BR93DRAFT_629845 [Coniochaeta sp. PMI_546]
MDGTYFEVESRLRSCSVDPRIIYTRCAGHSTITYLMKVLIAASTTQRELADDVYENLRMYVFCGIIVCKCTYLITPPPRQVTKISGKAGHSAWLSISRSQANILAEPARLFPVDLADDVERRGLLIGQPSMSLTRSQPMAAARHHISRTHRHAHSKTSNYSRRKCRRGQDFYPNADQLFTLAERPFRGISSLCHICQEPKTSVWICSSSTDTTRCVIAGAGAASRGLVTPCISVSNTPRTF